MSRRNQMSEETEIAIDNALDNIENAMFSSDESREAFQERRDDELIRNAPDFSQSKHRDSNDW